MSEINNDLTNTTWVINSIQCLAGYGRFYVDFIIDSSSYDEIDIGYYADGQSVRPTAQANSIVIENAGAVHLSVNDIITFEGGTDIANPDLITWLSNHATQVPVADLRGTSWIITSNPIVSGYGHYTLDFTVFGTNYDRFALGYSKSRYHGGGDWVAAPYNWYTLSPDLGDDISIGDSITFDSGIDTTNPSLIVWLSQNATYQEPAPVVVNEYTLAQTLTNINHGNMSFVINPLEGHSLPASSSDITVTDGSLVSYDSSTGTIVVSGSNATVIETECPVIQSNPTVTINCVHTWYMHGLPAAYYDGQDSSGIYLGALKDGESLTATITSGYVYSESAIVEFYSDSACRHVLDNPFHVTEDCIIYANAAAD